jgi:sucrose-6-phosphate hydrolase SacC (GH32 family)
MGAIGTTLLSGDLPSGPELVGRAGAMDSAEPYRPDYHFSPESGWMNDPNGLVYYDGTYHLFYQAGENRRRWDHATSTDLVTWTEHGTKIPASSTIQAFSGGGVVDSNDTSGFGTDAMVLMYTGHHSDGTEDQRLAYSTDGGDTVSTYADNPVIDTDHDDWRDPVPFWYEPADEWRAVICRVSGHEYRGTSYLAGVEVWKSTDLKNWTYLDTYESDGEGWECPDLYELPVSNTSESRWVMSMSVEWDHHEYHIGRFDGTTFAAENQLHVDDGHDFYAAQSWSNESGSGDRLVTAWLSEWDYAMDVPGHGWTGHQLFPRRVELYDTGSEIVPVQKPDAALQDTHDTKVANLKRKTISPTDDPLDGAGVSGKHLDIDVTFNPGDADTVTLVVREDARQETRITYDVANAELIFDRSESGNLFPGTSSDFPERGSHPLGTRSDGTVRLRVLLDASIVEVYSNNGKRTMCYQIYPDNCATNVSLSASGGSASLVRFTAHRTNSDSCTLGRRLTDGATYRIENRNSGLSLEVENASTLNGAAVIQSDYSARAHQQWTACQTSAGDWCFENVNSGNVIEIEDASTSQGASLQQGGWNEYDHQQWSLTNVDSGSLHLKNRNSDWALDIENASTSTGSNAMQWEYWAGNNQKWNFKPI